MPNYIEKVEQLTLPVVILRGSVAFPSIALSFEVTDSASAAAAQAASDTNAFVLLVAEKQIPEEAFHLDHLYKVGTVAKIKQYEKSLYELLNQKYADLLKRFSEGFFDDSDIEMMEKAINESKH